MSDAVSTVAQALGVTDDKARDAIVTVLNHYRNNVSHEQIEAARHADDYCTWQLTFIAAHTAALSAAISELQVEGEAA